MSEAEAERNYAVMSERASISAEIAGAVLSSRTRRPSPVYSFRRQKNATQITTFSSFPNVPAAPGVGLARDMRLVKIVHLS